MSVFNSCDKIIRLYLPTVMQSANVFTDNMGRENTIKIWCNHFRKYNTGLLQKEVEDTFKYILQDQINKMYTPGGFEKVLKSRRKVWPAISKPKPLVKADFKELMAQFKAKCKERDDADTYDKRKQAKKEIYDICMSMKKWDTGDNVNTDLQENLTSACFDDSYLDISINGGVKRKGLM